MEKKKKIAKVAQDTSKYREREKKGMLSVSGPQQHIKKNPIQVRKHK